MTTKNKQVQILIFFYKLGLEFYLKAEKKKKKNLKSS